MSSRPVLIALVIVAICTALPGALGAPRSVAAYQPLSVTSPINTSAGEPAPAAGTGTALVAPIVGVPPGMLYPPAPGCELIGWSQDAEGPTFSFGLTTVALLTDGSIEGFAEIQPGQRLRFETFVSTLMSWPAPNPPAPVWEPIGYEEHLVLPRVLLDRTSAGKVWSLDLHQRYIQWSEFWVCEGMQGIQMRYVLDPDETPGALTNNARVLYDNNTAADWDDVQSNPPPYWVMFGPGARSYRNNAGLLTRQDYRPGYPVVHLEAPPDGRIVESYIFNPRHPNYILFLPDQNSLDGYFNVTWRPY